MTETIATATRTTTGWYLYGIISAADAQKGRSIASIPGTGPVTTIVVGQIAAVVSSAPIRHYTVNRANLLAHEKVIEHMMGGSTILPVAFGTVADSKAELVDGFLALRHNELVALLNRFTTRIEVSVKVIWKRDAVFAAAAARPEIARLQATIGASADHTQKIALGQAVERALTAMRESDAEYILSRLRPLADNVHLHAVTLDMLVLNAAFLVDLAHEAEFDAAVNALDDELSERMIIKYAGPLPPFNFIHFNLNAKDTREQWDS